MDIVNWITYALFALVLFFSLIVAAGLPYAMWKNRKTADQYRTGLLTELGKTRLARMLSVLGIDPVRYVHVEPVVDVVNRIRDCAACTESEACDERLSAPRAVTIKSIDFCPNQQALESTLRRAEPASTGPAPKDAE